MKNQKALLLGFVCATVTLSLFAQTTIGRQKVDQYPVTSWGFMSYGLTWLPDDYDANPTSRYPLIIYLHGKDETGDGVDGLNRLVTTGLPQTIANGFNPEAVNPVDGRTYKFIVVSPQANTATQWSYDYTQVQWLLPDVLKRYRVDVSRIYVTGISAGGQGTWSCVTSGPAGAGRFAAIVPVSSATGVPADSIPQLGSRYGVKLYQVCGDQDPFFAFVNSSTNLYNSSLTTAQPHALVTSIAGEGHTATVWNKAYDPAWRDNQNHLNIYEWMLQYQRNIALTANQLPRSDAGTDQTITLPNRTLTLSGGGTDDDGSIIGYSWTKVSGPDSFSISSPGQAVTTVGRLTEGLYQFELTVTDDRSGTAKDTMTVTVRPALRPGECNGVRRNLVPSGDQGKYISGNPGSIWYTPVNPGDTLVLNAKDAWSFLRMDNYSGTAACPIVVTNEGGQVWLTTGIDASSCRNLKITGSGSAGTYYGIRVYNPGQDPSGVGVAVQGRSSSVEVERVDVYRKTYGIWAKQDPLCDTSFNYPNWVMDSINIHHCRFRNIGQDCIYAGNTDPAGTRSYSCNGSLVNFIPMRMGNVKIHHLEIDSCNRTGIQLSGAEYGYNEIHDNLITNCGYEFNQQQGTGISIGGMTRSCHVYNNVIRNTFLYGILDLGADSSFIENNTVDSSGYLPIAPFVNLDSLALALGLKRSGVYLKNTLLNGITNIQATTKSAYPHYTKTSFYRNNRLGANSSTLLENGGNITFSWWGPPEDWTGNNVVCSNTKLDGITAAKINQFIYLGQSWPLLTTNCGTPVSNIPPSVYAGTDRTITLPADSIMLDGSGQDADGQIAAYEWTKIAGPPTYMIAAPNEPKTIVNKLVQGMYAFELKVTDDKGGISKDTLLIHVNVAPVVNAGTDQTITLPQNSVTVNGTAGDADGSISYLQWSWISGPDQYDLQASGKLQTAIDSLVPGIYEFELQALDNDGAYVTDTVVITVNPAPAPNMPPTAQAGRDEIIQLPVQTVRLNGAGTDPDGTVVSWQWTKVSGPAGYEIKQPNTAWTDVNNLVQGTYQFELMVTDDRGGVGRDTVQILVQAAPPKVNLAPVAHAGADQVITLPVNTVLLAGAGEDADGTIKGYNWTKVSGPSPYKITNPAQMLTYASGLVQGVYQFELKVTDNQGATGRDTVTVIVNGKQRNSSTATVYPNPATTTIDVKIDAATAKNQSSIRIYDQESRMVYREDFLRTQQVEVRQINISNLMPGTYLMMVATDINNTITLKFIKQ